MEPLSSWHERLKNIPEPAPPQPDPFNIPRAVRYFEQGINRVESAEEASAMLQLAMERPLSHAGLDFEYKYSRPPVTRRKHECFDPSSILPLLSTITLVEPGDDDSHLYTFAVDVRNSVVLESLAAILRLPIPFVLHYAKGDLFCIWKLGMKEPDTIWDSWAHEKALHMGRNHARYYIKPTATEGEQIQTREDLVVVERLRYGLVPTCQRYNIATPFANSKTALQQSFLNHNPEAPFTSEQINYAAEDSLAVAKLYPAQVNEAARHGILQHLVTAEMPWTTTVARMEWEGLLIDEDLAEKVRQACADKLPKLEEELRAMGVNNAMSNPQLREFFDKANLLHLFVGRNGHSFDKKLLKAHASRHPAIPLISEARQIRNLQADGVLDRELIGSDGRMHPEHQQLGTHTGRQTSRDPNILGLPGVLRPLVIAKPGYGIGEVDLCQIEVGITAASYNDPNLIRMFNSGDVYSSQAQAFFSSELSEEDCSISGAEFKHRHPDKRAIMKTCTLAVIYGSSSAGLAAQLGVPMTRAEQFIKLFLDMFPTLELAKERASNCSAIRGYASTISGLKRNRGNRGKVTGWERRWLVNFPVQGSAAVAFKMAGNRLDKIYQSYGAKLLIPMHDAFIFEAPLPVLSEVAELTHRVLCETVQELFPLLRPHAEVNVLHPKSWNKDGDYESLVRWIIEMPK